MKVMLVGSHRIVCGVAFSMLKLDEELEKLGIDVVPVVCEGFADSELNKKQKKHYAVNSWTWIVSNTYSPLKAFYTQLVKKVLNFRNYLKFIKIIKKENPDIVHVNVLTDYVAAKAAIKCRKLLVWHIRELIEEDLNSHFWNKKKAFSLMQKANHLIAISKCVENKYRKIVGSEKISCVYNGVDADKFFFPHHTILNGEKIIITMAGRIHQYKGQYQCLEELAPLLKQNPNVILQFAGVGGEDELQKIQKLRSSVGLSDEQVRLLGLVKDMPELWENTDIAIVYSKFEAFGRVTVEAKMAGALVVGFNSGGTIELIENGKDGFLFGNGLPSLYSVVENVLSNKDNAKQIAAKGRESATGMFTSKHNAEQVVKIYKKVLKNS